MHMLETDPLVLPPVSELFALERSLPLTNEVSRRMYGSKAIGYKAMNEGEADEGEEEEEERVNEGEGRGTKGDIRLAPMLLEQSYTHTPALAAEPMQPSTIYSEVMLPSNMSRLDLNMNSHHHHQHLFDNQHMHSNKSTYYHHHERSQSAPNMIRYCAAGGNSSMNINSVCAEPDEATMDRSRKYRCQFCHKRFARPSSLRTHTYSHTGQRPFSCTFEGCDKRFSVLSNMRRHLRRHHYHHHQQQQQQDDSFLTRSNSSSSTATMISTSDSVLSD